MRALLVVGCAAATGAALVPVGAGARPVARAASCGGGGSGGSFFTYGAGPRIVSETDVPVCVSGRLTVTFAGDPAAGCATEGLCAYSGTETFAPGRGNVGDLTLTTIERHGHRSSSATLFIGGPSGGTASAVQRTVSSAAGTQTTSCSDDGAGRTGGGGLFLSLPVTRAGVRIDLAHASDPLLGSRCAGPLDADVAAALPDRTVALRALARGAMTVDLTGSGRFTSHGMTGTVTSTLALRLGRAQPIRASSPVSPGPRRARITHFGSVDYRVSRLTGDAVASVQSTGEPAACGPFDACGLAGTLTLSPGAAIRGSASLTAVSGRARPSVLRAELRGGGPSASRLVGGGSAVVRGTVSASLTQGAGRCADTVALHGLSIGLTRRGRSLTVSVAPQVDQAADPLRTRCPGPDLGGGMLASARVPASVLARRAFTVSLRGLDFHDGPYRVRTQSTLALTLTRGVARVRTIHVVHAGARSAVLGDLEPARELDPAR